MDVAMTAKLPVAGGALSDLVAAYKAALLVGAPATAAFEIAMGGGATRVLTVSWPLTVTVS